MSNIINKVKDALHKDHSSDPTHTTHTGAHTTQSGTAEGVAGPHNSRVANAADPRINSDLDGSRNAGAATGTSGYTGAHTGAHTGTGTGYTGSSTTGSTVPPHDSALLNKLDPRVDTNTATSTHTTGAHHNTGTTGGLTGTHQTTGTTGGLTGTHHNTGTTGGLSTSTNAGPHDSNLANKLDPRVDSDLDGRGNRVGAPTGGIVGASGSHATPGSGTAQNTAGPHNSDFANQIDPRVDSDMDGSRTAGGRTYQ